MIQLPATTRVLLGPGPSPVPARVMRAMSAPVLGHLDPDFLALLDDVRVRLASVFRAPQGSFTPAISGTGTAGVEAAAANLIRERSRVLVVVTGYFGDRLAQMCERYGGRVERLDVEWGRAVDPEAVRRALQAGGADVVAAVHAETSTGVLNPVERVAAVAREHGALIIVDAVTSLAAHPLDMEAWNLDACSSCSQKGIGAPSGMAPIAFSPRALARRAPARSFYLDIGLLQDYWLRRTYHHTLSAPLLYGLREALIAVDEEGLDARHVRHRVNHEAVVAGLRAMGLDLLPPEGERLWTLHAVRVPDGVSEAEARRHLLERFNIEIGAGLGPLAGRVWRVGFMGAGSNPQLVVLFLAAIESALRSQGRTVPPGAGVAAALTTLQAASDGSRAGASSRTGT